MFILDKIFIILRNLYKVKSIKTSGTIITIDQEEHLRNSLIKTSGSILWTRSFKNIEF